MFKAMQMISEGKLLQELLADCRRDQAASVSPLPDGLHLYAESGTDAASSTCIRIE